MHQLVIEVNQMDQLHLGLVFFAQMPKLVYQAKLSLQLIQEQELIKIVFYRLPEKQYSNIPSYPSVPVDLKFIFELLHSIIVLEDLATTLEK